MLVLFSWDRNEPSKCLDTGMQNGRRSLISRSSACQTHQLDVLTAEEKKGNKLVKERKLRLPVEQKVVARGRMAAGRVDESVKGAKRCQLLAINRYVPGTSRTAC